MEPSKPRRSAPPDVPSPSEDDRAAGDLASAVPAEQLAVAGELSSATRDRAKLAHERLAEIKLALAQFESGDTSGPAQADPEVKPVADDPPSASSVIDVAQSRELAAPAAVNGRRAAPVAEPATDGRGGPPPPFDAALDENPNAPVPDHEPLRDSPRFPAPRPRRTVTVAAGAGARLGERAAPTDDPPRGAPRRRDAASDRGSSTKRRLPTWALGLIGVVGLAAVAVVVFVVLGSSGGGSKPARSPAPVRPITSSLSPPGAPSPRLVRRAFTATGPGAGTMTISTGTGGRRVATIKARGLVNHSGGYQVWLSHGKLSTLLGALHRASAAAVGPHALSGSFRLPAGSSGPGMRILVAGRISPTSKTLGPVSLSVALPAG